MKNVDKVVNGVLGVASLIALILVNLFVVIPMMNEADWTSVAIGFAGVVVNIIIGVKIVRWTIKSFSL